MILTEKETTALRDLQTQEKSCITKYEKYAAQAKDTELQSLFRTLQQDEQKHYQSIGQALHGNVPECDCNDSQGKNYAPKGTYKDGANAADKEPRTVSVRRSWCRGSTIPMCSPVTIRV